MISTVENGRLVELNGDADHPYTKGKLCAKGYAFLERNYHLERLKFPYFQEVKGSGKFKKITWEKAFELIISEMMSIFKRYGSFLPIALLKGTGNLGVHHFVVDQFFSSIGETTRIVDTSSLSAGDLSLEYDAPDPRMIKEASMIIIWGANPAATNIHLMPFMIEAKVKGAKIVVIDPLYTQTAELADLYIQLRPSTDGALANALMKGLIEAGAVNKSLVDADSINWIKDIDKENDHAKCGISEKAFALLLEWLKDAPSVSYVIGTGIQKHMNGKQNFRAIRKLALVHGDFGKNGGGVFFRQGDARIFNNQAFTNTFPSNKRLWDINNRKSRVLPSAAEPPLELMWISGANPLTQAPNLQFWSKFIKEIPFVVAVEHFLTPTAKMSNLVLPTTTHFEELDMVANHWHKGIALNEKASSPYYECRSEWTIMKDLALKLNKDLPGTCSFPIHSSEEEYLDDQFNETVFQLYGIRKISDLKRRNALVSPLYDSLNDKEFDGSGKALERGLSSFSTFIEGESPTKEYPFWLITPHHPYRLNSQFPFLNLIDEKEAFVAINSKVAKESGILDGEIVQVFNNQGCIEIKARHHTHVPPDILLIYQGWYPESDLRLNDLVSVKQTNVGDNNSDPIGIAYYDTFVNVSKLSFLTK
jgi:anaerobic selenocysteine-containing dehydrogenase